MKQNAKDIGVCFEPLEPRLLLSGSWGAGVDAPSPDSLSGSAGSFGPKTVTLSASPEAFGSDALLRNQHALGTGTFVDVLANAPVLDAFDTDSGTDTAEPVTEAVPISNQKALEAGESPTNPSESDTDTPVETNAVERHELAFVNDNVADYEKLIADLQSDDDDRIIEVVVLDSTRDGIAQVSDILAGQSDLATLHFITHGSDGQINLGNTWLNSSTLQQNRDAVAGWGNALTENGDMLLYGCNVAADSDGQRLLDTISDITGADVAASDDNTGHTSLSGDWELEYTRGRIEAGALFSAELQQNWGHLLNVAVDATSTGTSTGGDFSVSHTTSGTDRLMLVGVSMNLGGSQTVSSVTYNGDSLSLVGVEEAGDARIEIWALLAPDVGTFNVDIAFSSPTDGNTAGVMTFTGVDQSTPLGAFASGFGYGESTASATVSSAADELVFGVVSIDDPNFRVLTEGAGQTERWELDGFQTTGGGSTAPGAESVNMSWTWPASDNWAAGGVSIKPSAANTAPTFAIGVGDGVATTPIGSSNDNARSIALQSDGKILVAGSSWNGTNSDFALVRYNSDGSLDTTFSGDGKVTTAIGSGDDTGYSVAVQSDGKILVAGYSWNGSNSDFALVRYNSDGSLDTTFSGDGILTTAIGTSDDLGYSVAVQADGKILVSGQSYGGGSSNDFALVRYNSDGSLDTSFSGDGKLTTTIGSINEYGYDVAVQADGKILVAGYSYSGTNNDFALVRYNSDGSLDTSFSGDGKLTTAVGAGEDLAYSVTVQTDGKILVAGYSDNGTNYDFSLVRYNSDGSLDTSFSGDGKVLTAIGTGFDFGFDVTVQADGKILVAGYSSNGSNNDLALVRYNSDGSLDTSFSGDGKLITAVGVGQDLFYSVKVQADGKILVAGYSNNGSNDDFALVRYNSDGSLDTGFDLIVTNTLDGAPTFTENGSAVVLDDNVQIFDAELTAADNFNGATLTLVRNGGSNAQDVFSATGTLSALTQGGNLVVGGTAIGMVTTNSGGTLVLTFDASATNTLVNSAMQQIAYSNSSDTPPASVQIDWTFNDGNTGAQGTGGALSATGSTAVTITAANDAPVNTVPGAQTTPEDTALEFSSTNGNAISISDADAGVNPLQITLTATNGTLTLNGTAGLAFSTGTGTADSIMVFQGTIVNINAALDGLQFAPTTGYLGAANIQITTDDLASASIGNTAVLGNMTTAGAYEKMSIATQIIIGSNGTVTSITAYLDNNKANNGVKYGIYADNTGEPGALLAEGTANLPIGAGWYTIDIPDTAVTAGNFWIGLDVEKEGRFFYDTTGGGTRVSNYDPSTGLPNPWTGTTTSNSWSLSAYASFTPNGNAGLTDTDTVQINVGPNSAPVITSNGGGATAGIIVAENTTAVITVTAIDADLDTLTYSISGGVDAALLSIDSSTGALTFVSTPDYESPADANADNVYEVTVNADDGKGGFDTQALSVTVTNVNDAPIMDNAGDMTLTTITEDETTNAGNTVAEIIASAGGDRITDPDAGSVEGIAVTGLSSSNGTWQYSINGGTSWNAVGAVSDVSALLLRSTDKLRFVPDAQNADMASVTFRAWDQTSGSSGSKVDVSVNGGTTAFSTATETASITVTTVNDAPSGVSASIFAAINEDNFNSFGKLVSAFTSSTYDPDTGALKGIAVTAVDNTNGEWQYTLDGTNWYAIGDVSINSARLLPADATTRVRFVPDPDFNAPSVFPFTIAAWDQTSGTAGGLADVSVNGGTTAFSAPTTTVSVSVTAVNDAPTATAGSVSLASVPEDTPDPAGETVSSLFGGVFSDAKDEVSGGSSANNLAGVAIVANTANAATQGVWQWYNGTGWVDIGTSVSTSSALVLSSATLVRFLPNANYYGTPGTLTARLIDDSSGAVTSGSTVNFTTSGGTTRYSDASNAVTLNTIITPLNDAPVADDDFFNIDEDTSLAEPADGVLLNDADVDGDTISAVLVSGPSHAASFSLSTDGSFSYTPDADWNGTDSFTYRASDGTVEGNVATVTITVSTVNDSPTSADDSYTVDEDATLTVGWWDTDWTRRQQLTLDNLAQSETLTDIPVLIVLNSGNIDYTQTKDDGSDLRFFAADGTPLAYEIEQWNEGGDSSVWVRVPQITGGSNSDSIWMYYGNAAATPPADPAGVWDSNFVGVWHLNEEQAGIGGTGVYKDSTSHGNRRHRPGCGHRSGGPDHRRSGIRSQRLD